jgi:hypothetical protein
MPFEFKHRSCFTAVAWPLRLAKMRLASPPVTGWKLECARLLMNSSFITARSNVKVAHGIANLEKTSYRITQGLGKDQWSQALRNYGERHGCGAISPATYDLHKIRDVAKILSLPKESTQHLFFKPPHGSRGEGIKVMSLSEYLEQCRCDRPADHDSPSAMTHCLSACAQPTLAQAYVQDLWLLGGRKFDNRVYLFVASVSPLFVLMRAGHVKIARYPFQQDSTDKLVNVVSEPTDDELLHYSVLLDDLVSQRGDTAGKRAFQAMVDEQVAVVVQFLLANRKLLAQRLCNPTSNAQNCTNNGHGYFGVDMIASKRGGFDTDVKWNIVDFNSHPAWQSHPQWSSNEKYDATIEATQVLFQGRQECEVNVDDCPWSVPSKHTHWVEIINEYASPEFEALWRSAQCKSRRHGAPMNTGTRRSLADSQKEKHVSEISGHGQMHTLQPMDR